MSDNDINELQKSFIRLDIQLDIIKINIEKLDSVITDIKVMQNIHKEIENKISILFHKFEDIDDRLNKFMVRLTFAFIMGGLALLSGILLKLIIFH